NNGVTLLALRHGHSPKALPCFLLLLPKNIPGTVVPVKPVTLPVATIIKAIKMIFVCRKYGTGCASYHLQIEGKRGCRTVEDNQIYLGKIEAFCQRANRYTYISDPKFGKF